MLKYNFPRRRLLPLVTLLPLLFISVEASAEGAPSCVATVQKVSGTAVVLRQGQAIPAAIGLEVRENDTLRTGLNGSLGVLFHDDTQLSLGPGSVLVIDEFLFAPREGKFSIVLRMLKGTASYLSGLISKLSPESAHFQTPTASIGIRGTKFVVKVEGE